MINSTNLQHVVQEELEWEPSVDASQIGVAAIQIASAARIDFTICIPPWRR